MHEEFQLAVQARAVGSARIGRVGAGEDRHVRAKLTHGVLGDGIIRRRPRQRRKSPVQFDLPTGREKWSNGRVPRQCVATAPARDTLEHRKRRDCKGMMRRHKPAKARIRRAVNEKVRQAIRPRLDSLARVLQRADVHYREFLARMGGGDHRLQCLLAKRREIKPECLAIVIDNLDVVRAFGDACVHKGLCLLRRGQRRNGQPIFCAVTAGRRHQGPRRTKVGDVRAFFSRNYLSDVSEHGITHEHVELRRNAEDQGGAEDLRPENVRM